MVFLTKITFAVKATEKSTRNLKRRFVDSLRLHVSGGSGGNGYPKYGGIGGKGGDVYVVAKEDIKLKDVLEKNSRKRVAAGCGGHSANKKLLGDRGQDAVIDVPIGITVFDEFGRTLGELNTIKSKLLVAQGGAGGSYVSGFSGLAGQAGTIILDLKLIADVGLVGFPNAGKSSLLKAISRAKPKVASYPFTTIEPNIGVLKYNDYRQITMADLPGLIEGAHLNFGMGHKFLKHVERTKLILLVIDINGFSLSPKHPYRSALETVVLLNKELEMYQEDILKKPTILAVNKMDLPEAENKWKELEECLKDFKSVIEDFPGDIRPSQPLDFLDIVSVSVLANNRSVLDLKEKIRYRLDEEAEKLRENEELLLRKQLKLQMLESGPSLH